MSVLQIGTGRIAYKSAALGNRQKVNYVQQGDGQPVILVHGLAASLHDWDDLLPKLADSGYAGCALDLLGHGESEKPPNPREYSVKLAFDHFSQWIDSLHRSEPLILIGHSLGGGLSLMYTLRHPDRVRALVLVNPFYEIAQLPPILKIVFRNHLFRTDLINRAPYRIFRFLVDVTSFSVYVGQRESHTLPEHVRYQTALDYKRASSGIYNYPRTLPPLTSSLSRITQPTLLLWGGRDQTLAPSSFPKLKSLLPNIRLAHEFPVCGHVPHQCHPEKFNPYVMEFLRSL
jgi:pimeloyl-ACP methyl ester carboxylesterase